MAVMTKRFTLDLGPSVKARAPKTLKRIFPRQCDQIWQFVAILAIFQLLWQFFLLSKSPDFWRFLTFVKNLIFHIYKVIF